MLARRPRVVLGEDHAELAKAVGRVLALSDVIGIVRDGSAVLENNCNGLLPDVIVLDLNLPNVSGLELCRQLRRSGFHNHIIVFTAMNDPVIVSSASRPEHQPSSPRWRATATEICCRLSNACVSS